MLLSDTSRLITSAGMAARWPFEVANADQEAVGLVRMFMASPHGMVDLATGLVATRSGSADPGRVNADGSLDAYFDGVDDQYSFSTDGAAVSVSTAFTVVWEAELDSFSDTYPILVHFRTGLSNSPLRIFYSSDTGYDDITVGYDSANKHAFLMPSGISRTGERHWGVWAYNGQGFTTTGNHRLWINGQDCSITTATSLASVTDDNRVGGSSAATSDWNGSIRQVRLYDREWAQDEAIRFWHPSSRDSLFRRPAAFTFFSTSTGAAELAGSATGEAGASGALTTQIQIAAAAAVIQTASGSLTTGIPLAGSAASITVSDGVLTANIRLSGDALSQVLASASLSGGSAALAGGANAAASASGQLTTSISLSGSAVAQALAAAGLTTGPSGLSGAGSVSASGSGALSTSIAMVGQASALAIATGGLSTGIQLTGSAAAVSAATGNLTISTGLSAAAFAQAAVAGTLSTQIRLDAEAVAQALASAGLSTGGSVDPFDDPRYTLRFAARNSTLTARARNWGVSIQ